VPFGVVTIRNRARAKDHTVFQSSAWADEGVSGKPAMGADDDRARD
jgi:hypothetical protein